MSISFWDGVFSGAMLVLGRGNPLSFLENTFHLVGVPAAAMFDKPKLDDFCAPAWKDFTI